MINARSAMARPRWRRRPDEDAPSWSRARRLGLRDNLAAVPFNFSARPSLTPRIFNLPAGAPFLPTLARALLSGNLVPGFPAGGPLDLARATIYLPTQRAASALARELVAASGMPSLILPRIAPLGAFEPTGDLGEADSPRLDERPAVGELTRRMTLARLTRAWGEALKGAIRRVDAQGRMMFDAREPSLVAASPAQALALAGDLAALIEDVIIEGLDWGRLDRLAPEAFDPYWRITLDFLKIATAAWPAWLDEQGLVDRATRAASHVEREIEALRTGAVRGPTIIAGSTGTNRATARLIGAIARAPMGAVVLPDLDLELDEESWSLIGGDDGGAVAGHPRAALRRLLRDIGVARSDVEPLGAPPPALKARARFLSEALRPAETTHLWGRIDDTLDEDAIARGLADVALIVAADEAEEALALAIAMREALETPGKTAALITPDPAIARRVAAELARWDIEVENSAGRALGDTSAGAFARLALAAALDFAPLPLAALLRHPLALLGREPEIFSAHARALELAVLRAPPPPGGLGEVDAALAAARKAHGDRHAHPALRSLREADLDGAEALLRDLLDALAPLRGWSGAAPLGQAIEAHRAALEPLAAPGALATAPGGEALEALFDEWSLASEEAFGVTLGDYSALFDTLLAISRAPPEPGGHPRLAMLGLLEARLLNFDLALLAGLDETVWPPAVQTDAFLNRPMRAQFGLSPPERRIGQTAHDFTAALGAPEAVLSRSAKRGGAPTVASRFWQRIAAVAGEVALGAASARGDRWLGLARALDRPEATAPILRPEPRPKPGLRPERLSVTRIETLRRDPYAIYAESILKLAPLNPIGPEIGPREIGDVWHAVLEDFARTAVEDEAPDDAQARLYDIAENLFAPLNADPAFRALRWPRIAEGLETFLSFDAEHRELAARIWVELDGRLEIPLRDGSIFRLTARADRIERLRDGGAALIDYKTGAPPGLAEVRVGFAPQLTLEAAILARGGFAEIGTLEATAATYLKLGGADGGFVRELKFKDESFAEVVERHFAGAKDLLEQFRDEQTPYLSRPFPKFAGRGGDYDHLARVSEWSATGGFASGGGDEP
jgi:ATP-dependent helicase/nuclease subunit B